LAVHKSRFAAREQLHREASAARSDEVLRILRRFRDRKRDQFGILHIGVCGSVARAKRADVSDVDVVVEVSEPDVLALVGIKQQLEELLHLSVDVVWYRERMNPLLNGRINQEAICV
jgi:predicted nucleotidyltransferase